MSKKIKFNISASSYSMYKQSPLMFYYTYIKKSKPDTVVNKTYGLAGNIVHNILEEYGEDKTLNYEKLFNERWDEKNLNELKSFNGKPLCKKTYFNALRTGVKLLDNVYSIVEPEMKIVMNFYEDSNVKIGLKGFIDCVCKNKNDELIILDWKTNSSKGDFTTHALMYHLLYYKKFNKLPKKAVYEYLKIGDAVTYEFTLDDVLNFEKELYDFCKTISKNCGSVKRFSVGDIDSPFNAHKQKCLSEVNKRNLTTPILCAVKDNFLIFKSLPEKLRKIITLKYSYCIDGYEFCSQVKSGAWDGRVYFFKKNKLPYAFVNDVKELLVDFNVRFDTNYVLKLVDYRCESVKNCKYDTVFKESEFELRDYQREAVNTSIINEVGILAMACGSGKTFVAAEIIRRLNTKTLFLVNRLELAEQSKREFENYLGVSVGLMTEGNVSCEDQIVIASIQTIHSIIKRKDESTKVLQDYLSTVNLVIADESQNLKNSKQYRSVYGNTVNATYFIGLSATPFRNGGDTLEMNALVGFPIFWKTSEELTKEGFLCPTKCLFIKNGLNHDCDDYHSAYDECIVNNDVRNGLISGLANSLKGSKKVLILTRRVKHAHLLADLIPGSVVITGSTKKSVRRDEFERFKNESGFVLIGSTKIFSTGVNIPSLDVIINGTAHKSSIDSIQIIGRTKRLYPGKKVGYYVDFVDEGKYFGKASGERMKSLCTFGEDVVKVSVNNIRGEIE